MTALLKPTCDIFNNKCDLLLIWMIAFDCCPASVAQLANTKTPFKRKRFNCKVYQAGWLIQIYFGGQTVNNFFFVNWVLLSFLRACGRLKKNMLILKAWHDRKSWYVIIIDAKPRKACEHNPNGYPCQFWGDDAIFRHFCYFWFKNLFLGDQKPPPWPWPTCSCRWPASSRWRCCFNLFHFLSCFDQKT